MNNKFNNKKIWIGLIKVKQSNRGGVLGDADLAYTNAIGLAKNRSDFRAQIKSALNALELQLIRLENAEPLDERLKKYTVHKDIHALAKNVSKHGQIAFHIFATFDE
jgi:hypothetical protein